MVIVAAVAAGSFVVLNRDMVPMHVASEPAPVAAAPRGSVLKIHSEMASCRQYREGSAFVVAPNRLMSRAADVAGANAVEVDNGDTKYPAHVVYFDPNTDVAILEVAGLPVAALKLDTQEVRPETDAVVVGYPDGGDLTTTTVQIHETVQLKGPNIYKTDSVDREVYILNGSVDHGGPLIGHDGAVLGMVFGASVDDKNTGFALTANELSGQMSHVGDTEPVSTGACQDG